MVEWQKATKTRIVVDANIIIAALFGSRATLAILTSQNYSFYAPEYVISEIKRHKEEICKEAGKLSDDFDNEINALLKFINIVDESDYIMFMEKAEEVMRKRDIKDAKYIATALRVRADFIWTNDKDFREQRIIKIKNTDEFIEENR
ncbi:MAG: putative toxin-antitoxin system toxin component, PIN family [Nanoarchaeota archaeon]